MKKTILLFLVLISQFVDAQYFVEFSGGYSIPYNLSNDKIIESNNSHNMDYYKYQDNVNGIVYEKVKYIKFNPGNGFFGKMGFGYRLKNFSFSIETDYLDNRRTETDSVYNKETYEIHNRSYINDTDIVYSHLYGSIKYYVSWWSITPKISYGIRLKKISFYGSIGVAFDYLTIYRNNIYYLCGYFDNEATFNTGRPYYLRKEKYLPYLTFSPVAGFSVSYSLNDSWSLIGNFNYRWKLYESKRVVRYYTESLYRNGKKVISTEEQEIDKDYNAILLTNYRIGFGLRYSFGKKAVTTEE